MGSCCSSCFRSRSGYVDSLGGDTGWRGRPLLSLFRGDGGEGRGGGQRLGTAAEHAEERRRTAEEAAAARAAQAEPERIVDPNLSESERQRQRELRIQAAEKRTAPKKPKAPLSNQEFRNPNRDPNTMQWTV